MIVCTVKTYDLRKEKNIKEGAFDNAWFRLQNEDTNQSIDYISLKTIETPEGYVDETGAAAEEEGEDGEAEQGERNELTYICGRVWLNDEPKKREDKIAQMSRERSQKSLAGEEEEEGSKPAASRNDASQASISNEAAQNGKWVYERFNMVTTSSAMPNIV